MSQSGNESTACDHATFLRQAWDDIGARQEPDVVNLYFAPDYVRHGGDRDYTREEFQGALRELYEAIPDARLSIDEVICEGDRVAYRWSGAGTHSGAYLGIPPTHKRITLSGITISRFGADGTIVEDWASYQPTSFLHSLGIVPVS